MQLQQPAQIHHRRRHRRARGNGLPVPGRQPDRLGSRQGRQVPVPGQRRGAGRTLPARLARGTAAGIRHAVHPRTGQYFDQERRRGRTSPPYHRNAGQRRQRRLFGSQPHPDQGIPRPGYDRRTPRGHRKGVRATDSYDNRQQPRQFLRRGTDAQPGLRTFGTGNPGRNRQVLARDAADQGTDRAENLGRTEAQDRRRPALHRHCAEQCRGAARIAQVGDRQPGQQVHARGLLGFVVRPLHG